MRPSSIASIWLLAFNWRSLLAFVATSDASSQTPSKRQPIELPYYFQAERLISKTVNGHHSESQFEAQGNWAKVKRAKRRHIRVVTTESPPFMMKRERNGGDNENKAYSKPDSGRVDGPPLDRQVEWHGYCMDFFKELLKYLPYELSYDIYEAPDKRFGSKTREIVPEGNGRNKSFVRREHWNGMIGELASGRAQLALAPMSVMAERELVVDFTVPFYDLVGIQILLKRPEVPRDWFKFLTVLDNEVWLSITVAYFVTSLIIYLFDRLSPYSHKNMRRVERIRAKRRQLRSAARGPLPENGATISNAMNVNTKQVSWLREQTPLEEFSRQRGTLLNNSSSLIFPMASSRRRSGEDIQTISGFNSSPHSKTSGSTKQVATPRRRLSQDYLQSLRLRRLNTNDSVQWEQASKFLAAPPNEQNISDPTHTPALDDSSSESSFDDGKPDFNLRDSLWFCITSLTPQGGGEAPQNLSGRVVAGAWWLFCFIVIASYTANLAAFLTVSRLDIPIESLDDLAKQYRIKYAPIEGTAEQSFFERMAYIEEIFYNIWKEMSLNDSLSEEERSRFATWDYPISDKYTKIWSQIQEIQMPRNLSQAIERVKASTLEDGFALLANANIIRYATMTDCQFRAVGEEFSRKPIALALEKNQEDLRDDLSYAILQLINKRYMEVLREKWWTNNPSRLVCDLNDDSEGISIENIGGVFIIILTGVLLSFLVWALERLLYATKLDVSREMLLANHRSTSTAP